MTWHKCLHGTFVRSTPASPSSIPREYVSSGKRARQASMLHQRIEKEPLRRFLFVSFVLSAVDRRKRATNHVDVQKGLDHWTIGNDRVERKISFTDGKLQTQSFRDVASGRGTDRRELKTTGRTRIPPRRSNNHRRIGRLVARPKQRKETASRRKAARHHPPPRRSTSNQELHRLPRFHRHSRMGDIRQRRPIALQGR